jgi:alpha-1,6-mannosyltransferase
MTTNLPRRLAQGLFLTTSLTSLFLCPHSKVEESFYIQATHDLYYHGVFSIHDYDHLQYPGVVPRSFVAPILLSIITKCISFLLTPVYNVDQHPDQVLCLARLALLFLSLHAWFRFAAALDKKHSTTLGTYVLIITACQFHAPFYASRMLANVFCTILVLHAYSYWIGDNQYQKAAACMVVTMVVFRCDVLLLLVACGLSWLYCRQLTIVLCARIGTISLMLGLLISVPIDSYFWQQWTWPEGVVLYYNTVMNKSNEWGVSPWYWYWLSALPKALLATALLIPLAVLRLPEVLYNLEEAYVRGRGKGVSMTALIDTTWLPYLLPAVGFVALYSCLGHKEMRFLFPVMPLINLAAAVGLDRVHKMRFPSKGKPVRRVSKLAYLACIGAVLTTFIGSTAFVLVSRWNYPGGDALEQLVSLVKRNASARDNVVVYVDVASAMTGVSLFGQRYAQVSTPNVRWTFQKGGYEQQNVNVDDYSKFTHILTENAEELSDEYQVLAVAQGTPRLDLRRLSIVTSNTIYVLG